MHVVLKAGFNSTHLYLTAKICFYLRPIHGELNRIKITKNVNDFVVA